MALYVKFDCATCENENCYGHSLPTTEKVCDGYKHTITNADKIRSMTNGELAEWITELTDCTVYPSVRFHRANLRGIMARLAETGGERMSEVFAAFCWGLFSGAFGMLLFLFLTDNF